MLQKRAVQHPPAKLQSTPPSLLAISPSFTFLPQMKPKRLYHLPRALALLTYVTLSQLLLPLKLGRLNLNTFSPLPHFARNLKSQSHLAASPHTASPPHRHPSLTYQAIQHYQTCPPKMFDHRGFGSPTLPSADCSTTANGAFLRLTPIPKTESAINDNDSAAQAATKANIDANACACAYCARHTAVTKAVKEGSAGLRILTNCVCSPCSSTTTSPVEEAP